MPRRSEPAPGSVMARQSDFSPRMQGNRYFSRCSGVPASRMFEGRADAGPVQRVVGAAELLLVEQPGHRIEAGAADIGRHVGGIEPGVDRLGLELLDAARGAARRCARPPAHADKARSRRRRASSRRSASALRTGRNPWRSALLLAVFLRISASAWRPSPSSPALPPWPSRRFRLCLLRRELRELLRIVLVQRAGAPALALVLLRQRIHDRDQIVVADSFPARGSTGRAPARPTASAIRSTSSSLNSGTSISLVHGHFRPARTAP